MTSIQPGPAGATRRRHAVLRLRPDAEHDRATPGNLIIHLRKLEVAGYLSSAKTRNGTTPRTTVTLTGQGRTALAAYTQVLRDLLGTDFRFGALATESAAVMRRDPVAASST